MPGLVPGIHVFDFTHDLKTWMAGPSPAMTQRKSALRDGSSRYFTNSATWSTTARGVA